MFLVHAELSPSDITRPLPDNAGALLFAQARPEEGVEHLATHPQALPHPIVGVYLIADTLLEAEETATRFCRRALAGCRELSGWRLVRAQAPLPAPLLLAAQGW